MSLTSSTQTVAGGLEQGLEHGIWGGVKGAILGYMTLPVIVGLAVGIAVGVHGFNPFGLGAGLFGTGLAGGALAGAAATAVTTILAYPLNRGIAKLFGLVGGVVGFASGVDEPEKDKGQTIQLSPDQELVVVNKSSGKSNALMNASLADANVDYTKKSEPETIVRSDEAQRMGDRVTELVHQYSK